jgi:hypothetical protein
MELSFISHNPEMGGKEGGDILLANILTLVINVTIFDFILLPSEGAPKLGSVVEGFVDQPTVSSTGIVSMEFVVCGFVEGKKVVEGMGICTSC